MFSHYLLGPLAFAGFLGFLLGYDLVVGWKGSGGGNSVRKRNCLSNSEIYGKQQTNCSSYTNN